MMFNVAKDTSGDSVTMTTPLETECRLEAGVVEAADDAEDGLAVTDGGVQGD